MVLLSELLTVSSDQMNRTRSAHRSGATAVSDCTLSMAANKPRLMARSIGCPSTSAAAAAPTNESPAPFVFTIFSDWWW